MDVVNSIITPMHQFFLAANGILWGPPMIVLLLGVHLYMTIRTKFIQRKVITGIKLSIKGEPDAHGDVSQFGALSTALAATIGTGNIVGVGTAVALGGPGAVLWVWLTGVFGMATKYAESLIAVKYRVKNEDGYMQGGAMYALERGLNAKWLGVLFALFASIAAFGIGCSVQSNAVASTLQSNLNVPVWLTAAVIGILMAVIIFGGVKAIARWCEKLVPFMAAFYIVCSIIILFMLRDYVGPAFVLIFKSAFRPEAFGGGVVGAGLLTAMRYGVARGLFSNESGMGSAPIVAASAQTKNPARQALVSMTGTFWDTVVVCLITGLVLVSSMLSNPALFSLNPDGSFAIDGSLFTSVAFSQIPVIGTPILSVSLALFAFSTILGWSYYGERAFEYLFGSKPVVIYRVLFIVVAVVGALIGLQFVWDAADTLNALMVIPNVIAVFGLAKVIAKDTNYYIYEDHLDEEDQTPIPVVTGKFKDLNE
ncbi:MAG: sodium:alanine symporter family protein [Coriobacteriia bacterium]|nr:sodium:alanine symporter family protein [Coriobacteriia bacterium]